MAGDVPAVSVDVPKHGRIVPTTRVDVPYGAVLGTYSAGDVPYTSRGALARPMDVPSWLRLGTSVPTAQLAVPGVDVEEARGAVAASGGCPCLSFPLSV